MEVIRGDLEIWHQVVVGIIAGTVIALGAWWIISRQSMRPVLDRYAELIGPLMPMRWIQWLVSVCAGVGEELFFRGAIQHWLGIPFTAVVFVALHGYLDPRDGRVLRYGLYMTVAMLAIGWWAQWHGLIAPMIAHAVIDVVLIARLVRHWRSMAS
ncbi:MAG: CPBP family intramembrane metalloprotease [Flavobacteriales bacterium]|nr:CPBP family intramembrane metalloprotease [Flavobacteriales bacterium]